VEEPTTSTGRLVFHIFAALAEFERELIVEPAAVGRAAARARGRLGGLPAKLSPEQTRLAQARYEARDVTVAEIARALGVGRGTIYRALQQTPLPPLGSMGSRPRRTCRVSDIERERDRDLDIRAIISPHIGPKRSATITRISGVIRPGGLGGLRSSSLPTRSG